MTDKKSPLWWGQMYADNDIPVAPLIGPNHTHIGGGYLKATTDKSIIEGWCNKYEVAGWQANLKQWTVVDVDDHPGADGPANMAAFLAEHGIDDALLKDTPSLKTKTGEGRHYWFSTPFDTRKIGAIKGVDIIENPYLPPYTGYTWEVEPWEGEYIDLPEAFKAVVREQSTGEGKQLPPLENVQQGNRNESLAKYLGQQRHYGASEDELLTYALGWNQRIDDPLPIDEVRAVAHSVARYKPGVDREQAESEAPPENDKSLSMFDLMDQDYPPDIPIIGPINAGKIAMLVAPTGSGKSFLAHSLAEAAATAQRVRSWPCMAKHKVLLIDGELTGGDLKRMGMVLGITGMYDVMWNKPDTPVMNLMDSKWQDYIFEIARHYQLVIFDNLYSLFPTTNDLSSISAEYMQTVQRLLTRLRTVNTTSLVFDHIGKSGKQFGTSAKTWGCDLVGMMTREDGQFEDGQAGFWMTFKGEDGGKIRGQYDTNLHGNSKWLLKSGRWDS
jgi:hypothetical protein